MRHNSDMPQQWRERAGIVAVYQSACNATQPRQRALTVSGLYFDDDALFRPVVKKCNVVIADQDAAVSYFAS